MQFMIIKHLVSTKQDLILLINKCLDLINYMSDLPWAILCFYYKFTLK